MIEPFGDRAEGVPTGLLAALWLLVCAALIWSGWTQITTLEGWDPDDALRLVQLRDFLSGQSWFDSTQYRMNPPEGAPMHWSRLVELPLAMLVLLLRPIFGQPAAEMIAGTAVPLLLLGWIAWLLARIATRLSSREAGVAAALITLSTGALLIQLRPMRIDHHGWQLAMAVLALSTLFWKDVVRAGLVLGLALAVWLHISLEAAPMTAAYFLLLGFRWVREARHGRRLLWTIGAFAGVSAILFFGTQAAALAAPIWCDTVSPPHIYAIGWAAAAMLAAIKLLPDDWRLRLGAAAVAGGGALAILLATAPQCAGGAFGTMDPLVREYWYSKINEGLPIWHQNWRTALNLGAGLICGALSWVILRVRIKRGQRQKLDTIGFFLFYGVILSIFVTRTISVATAYAIPVTAMLIALLFNRYRRAKLPVQRVTLVAVMLLLLVPGAAVSSLVRVAPDEPVAKVKPGGKAEPSNEQCQSALSVRALRTLPRGTFLAPFDMGPTILAQTPHNVLASSHHRNEQAMHDHIQIFRSEPDTARELMLARGIDYLAACPKEAELGFYAKKDPRGLWAQIAKGKVPAWLEPLPERGEGIRVWQVR
jgi:hypothetical protein